MRRTIAAVTLILTVSCATDKMTVQNAAAAYIFYEDLYTRQCVVVAGSSDCPRIQKALIAFKAEIQLANKVYVVGKMPPPEVKRLTDAEKELKAWAH